MNYCTRDDLAERYPARDLADLADRDLDGVADGDVLDMAIASAAGTIDAYLSPRYALPLGRVPQALVDVACDLAVFRLFKATVPELVQARYDAALGLLRELARGTAGLPGQDDGTAPPAENPCAAAPERAYGDEFLRRYL